MSALIIRDPSVFDVILATNLFGDNLSDAASEIAGGLGLAESINAGDNYCIAQAQHGSAPDIAGKGIANPIGQIWSGAMMLDYLGEKEAAARIVSSIEKTLLEKQNRTKDLDGDSNTKECANKILDNIN